ncbi:MAG: hypothetical protein U5S82_18630 [Gammaproteobacteria bacterium]|nr:hypothetical protein [Gammaproteobacteria bacterium]
MKKQPVTGGIAPHHRGGILTASRHAMGRAESQGAAPLQAQPPPPPLWRRTDLLPYAFAVVVVLGLAGLEVSMRIQTHLSAQRLVELDAEFEERVRLANTAQAVTSESRRIAAEVDTLDAEVDTLQRRKHALDRLLQRRQSAPGMLEAMRDAVTDEVMLDRFVHDRKDDTLYYVSAWALTNTAGQLFINNLGRHLQPWGLRVQDHRISTGTNRFNGRGYEIEVWLQQARQQGGDET